MEVQVERLDRKGRGVGTHGERRVAVRGALPGERVMARINGRRRGTWLGATDEVLDAAPGRVAPPCPQVDICSGCSLQHLSPGGQLEHKQRRLLDALADAGVSPAEVFEPLRGPSLAYRRRARLSVREVPAKGRVLVGFREPNGRYVADLDHCPVLDPRVGERLTELAGVLGGLSVSADIPQVEVACGDDAAALVIRHLAPLTEADRDRLCAFQADSGLRVLLQPGAEDSVHALDDTPLELHYRLPDQGLDFSFLPTDFVQVNAAINQALVMRALALLDPAEDDRVLDLFCGIGNFSLPLAQRSAAVTGLEGDVALVERARGNARRNGLRNVSFEACDLYTDPAGAQAWNATWDAVLLDPPRTGAEAVLPQVAASGARRVVYVSCHPDSLARDAALLVARHGFRLVGAGVVDMFPHTAHMESIALFERDMEQ